jgi:hypothetical protein
VLPYDPGVEPVIVPQIAVLAGGGLVGGLGLLIRGFGSYRTGLRIADTSTSTITSLAVGEVRVSGVVEPAELTLVSPLQSVPCVYYRASIRESGSDVGDGRDVLGEERSVGFRVRDADGVIRVFPRGGRFDVPNAFDESTGAFGDAPLGLQLREGPAYADPLPDREAQIAALLTVRQPDAEPAGHSFGGAGGGRSRRRRYAEARIEPGQVVTVVGQAIPFDQLPDPRGADVGGRQLGMPGSDDPEVALSIAEARATGTLLADPAAAWGNAAIPGFGIGQPIAAPTIDAAATPLPLAAPEAAERARRTFEIGPRELVIAATPDTSLLVALGAPSSAAGRQQQRFLQGLLGAVLAIGSAVALGVMFSGGFGA